MDGKNIGKVTLILAVLGLMIPQTPVMAQKEGASTLEGLKSIYVDVTAVADQLEAQGLRKDRIKSDTERKLKRAGIPVVSQKEYTRLKRTPRYPLAIIELSLDLADIDNINLRIYTIKVQVKQVVFLARKPVVKIWSTTWERRKIVGAGSLEIINKNLSDALEEFIGDFSSVNR
jgi:hypothetical protein